VAKQHPATSELLDRLPPCNLDAERAVIGSVLLKPSVLETIGFLEASDFHGEVYGVVFGRLKAMKAMSVPIDTVTLVEQLRAHGELLNAKKEQAGRTESMRVGMADIAECLHAVPVADHAGYYARLVVEASFRRRVIQAAVTLIQWAHNPEVSTENLQATAARLMRKIQEWRQC